MKSKLSAILKHSCIILLSIVFFDSNATIYYSQKSLGGSANAASLTAWNSSATGGGSIPLNFSSGDQFQIINGDNMIPTSKLTISGGGKLVIVNGTFTANGYDHALTVDIQNTSEYIVKSAYQNLILGNLNLASTFTVQYVNGGSVVYLRYLTYSNNLNINILTTTTTTNINITAPLNIGGNLTLKAPTYLNRNINIATNGLFTIGGNLTIDNAFLSATTSSFTPFFNINGNLNIINNGILASTSTAGAPTFNITGDFVMSSGVFYGALKTATGNSTYNIGGNLLLNGGQFVGKYAKPTGTAKFILSGNGHTLSFLGCNVTNSDYQLTVSGIYTMNSDVTTPSTLTIANTGSLSIGANTLNFAENFPSTSGTLIGGSNSKIAVIGTKAIAISLPTLTLYSLTINDANATVTLAGNTSILNYLYLTQGSIDNNSSVLTLANNTTIERNKGTLSKTPTFSGLTNFIYTSTSSIPTGVELPDNNTTSINNVTFSNTGTSIELYSTITINGNLTINSGSTFYNKSKILTIKGNIVNNGTFSNLWSTTVFAGTTTLSGSSTYDFSVIQINTGATLISTTGAMNIGDSFTPLTGSTFIHNQGTVNFNRVSGIQNIPADIPFWNLGLLNGATKTFSTTNTTYISNALSVSGGPIVTTSSSINFNGNNTQYIPALNYVTLILSGSGLKIPASAITVSTNLIIAGTAVLDGSNTTITSSGSWLSSNASSYTAVNGLVVFNNNISINSNGVSFNNITFSGAGAKTFTSEATVTGVLTVSAGTANTGNLLTVNLTTGSISGTGSGTLNGNVTFVKNIPTGASNFLAFPVAGATGNDLADDFEFVSPSTNKSRLSIWDCSTQKYLSGQNVNTAFTQGIGFQFYATVSGNVDVTGVYNHKSPGYTTTACSSVANKFVLAGNPYPSTLDWNSTGWTKTNLNDAIYFFNPVTSTFASYVNGSASNGGSQYIPSFQGFYITTNGGGIGSLTATNAVRTTLTNPSLYRTTTSNIFALEVSYKQYTDEAVIVLNNDASFDFESDKDAIKLINPDAAPSLYTKSLGIDYSVNSIPSLGSSYVLPLGLQVRETGSYTFSPKNVSDIEGSVFLEDKLTGQLVDLKASPSHTVTVDSTQTDRFQLRFASSGNASTSTTSTKIYYYDGIINVSFINDNSNGTMALYSVLGNAVIENVTITGSGQVATTNIKPGAYIVRVVENGQISIQKIIVQ